MKAICTGIKFCEKHAIAAMISAKYVLVFARALLTAFIRIAVRFVLAIAAASAPSRM